MDHLPQPLDGHVQTVDLYAYRSEYRPGDFFSLFEKPGLDFDVLLAQGYDGEKGKEGSKPEFLQEWLFFALLAQFLDKTISLDMFKRNDRRLHTESLPVLLEEWSKVQGSQLLNGPTVAQKLANTHTRRALADARRYVEKHCSIRPTERDLPLEKLSNNGESTKMDCLYLSFAILGETLEQAILNLKVPEGCKNDFWKDLSHNDKSWGHQLHNHKTFLKTNRCPADVRRLESTFNGVLARYCASTMKPAPEQIDGVSHATCSPEECRQHQEPNKWHFEDYCQPQDDKVAPIEFDKLEAIAKQGQIPLLTWAQGSLQVQGYDRKKKNLVFGALSHRWKDNILVSNAQTDGSRAKEVFACQLKALQQSFNDGITDRNPGDTNVPFWVDSLCTTKVSADQQSASISESRHIYKNAKMVLVWDRGLLQTSKNDRDKISHTMRIRASPWARRMWTLLESIVSPKLVFEFKNGSYKLSELEEARDRARDNQKDPYHFVWRLGEPYSPAIADLRSQMSANQWQSKYHRIACLWRAAQFRLVTSAADETIILANVLGINVKPILQISGDFICEERMVKFLELLDKASHLGIPPGIIFLPGTALKYREDDKTKGYGWAPRSWLSERPQTEANPLLESVHESFIGRQGLFVTYPGVLLHCSSRPSGNKEFWIPVDQHLLRWYNVIVESPDALKDIGVGTKDVQLALILSTKEMGPRLKIGALVRCVEVISRGRVQRVSIISRVWIRLETDRDTIGERVKEMRNDNGSMFHGEELSDEQVWCVDRNDEAT